MKKIILFILSFTLLVCLGSKAQTLDTAIINDPLIKYYAIKGIIADADSNYPLSGAIVNVLGTNLYANSDLEGRYKIVNIPQGSYIIQVKESGYQQQTKNIEIYQSDSVIKLNFNLQAWPGYVKHPQIVLSPNCPTFDLAKFSDSIKAIRETTTYATIYGIVKDVYTKEPIRDAFIRIIHTSLGAYTNKSGKYKIKKIPPGAYEIQAIMTFHRTVTVTEIPICGGSYNLDFSLKPTNIKDCDTIKMSRVDRINDNKYKIIYCYTDSL